MANPNEDNDFGLGELRSPLRRAEALKQRHEKRSFTERVWDFAVGVAPYASVGTSPWLLGVVAIQDPRMRRVARAAGKSLDAAARMMGTETLQIGHGLLAGIVPMLGDLAMYAGIGAVAGGAVGAVGGLGVGDEVTIPGGALGGAELGLWIGGFLGLKDVLIEGVKHLGRFATYAIDATELAWYAGEDRAVEVEHDVDDASKLFAVAISELWWVILQALIAWVMKRAFELGGKAAGTAIKSEAFQQALNEAKGKTAKFGTAFGDWFEKNFDRIKQTVDRRQQELKAVEDGDAGTTAQEQASPSDAKKPTLKPGSDAHKAQRWKDYQDRGGEWDYDRWSKTYDNNMERAKLANKVADDYQQQLGWGTREVTVDVDGQARRLDIGDIVNRRGVEVKSGDQYLTQDNASEIARDKSLVDQGWDIEWHFDGHASAPLQDALKDANIRLTGARQ